MTKNMAKQTKLTIEQVQKAFPEFKIVKELKSRKTIIEENYQKLIEKGYRCCFCGKKDVGLLFDTPHVLVYCRNTNCSPSYRWCMRIPNDNLEVFDIIPRD